MKLFAPLCRLMRFFKNYQRSQRHLKYCFGEFPRISRCSWYSPKRTFLCRLTGLDLSKEANLMCFELDDSSSINKYEYNSSMSLLHPWSLERDEFTTIKSPVLTHDMGDGQGQMNQIMEGELATQTSNQYGTETLIDEKDISWLEALDILMNSTDENQVINAERNPNQQELGEEELERQAFQSLSRVLPDINLTRDDTDDQQLAVLKGAIKYIKDLETTLNKGDNELKGRTLTRLNTAAGPLIGFKGGPEPKRPKNGFIRFSIKNRRQIARAHPGVDNREISRILGLTWKNMNREQKRPYEEEFLTEMKTRRKLDPNWRYSGGMRRRLLEDLIEPMPSRLRPRDQLRPKVEVSKLKRPYRKRQTPQYQWVQCDNCQKWRRLPKDTNMNLLPLQWYCYYNMDPIFNHCSDPEEFGTLSYPIQQPEPYLNFVCTPACQNIYQPQSTATSSGNIWNQNARQPVTSTMSTSVMTEAEARVAVQCFSSFSRFRWQHGGRVFQGNTEGVQLTQTESMIGVFGTAPGEPKDVANFDVGSAPYFQ